jgi:hypothetical protein
MILLAARLRTGWVLHNASLASMVAMYPTLRLILGRQFHSDRLLLESQKKPSDDPRINDIGRAIEDDFATIRETYGISIPSYF